MNKFFMLTPILQAFIAGTINYLFTAAGASLVFLFNNYNKKVMDFILGFAAGVMIAASFWSLLNPAIEMASASGKIPWLIVSIGFLTGGFFLRLIDFIVPHLHMAQAKPEGIKSHFKRIILLVLAITIHNIPEGLAVGVVFGSLNNNGSATNIFSAIVLSLGIGIQNFPEGAAVSLPLRGEGYSRARAFFYGQISGIVEPISALLGAVLVIIARPILPYSLAFAAGAMIYVVVEEIIPEAQSSKNSDLATMGTLIGFVTMMILDVAFS
ncbi:MAG: ZIP family metal transporter [Spirochaetes bacterium]|nr:ZIP family metal transporter [Spirochaetota bacterium]